jgi:hypothetical protein
MSMAPRVAKWMIFSAIWAGQAEFVHRHAASPSSLYKACSQTGQWVGITNGF